MYAGDGLCFLPVDTKEEFNAAQVGRGILRLVQFKVRSSIEIRISMNYIIYGSCVVLLEYILMIF